MNAPEQAVTSPAPLEAAPAPVAGVALSLRAIRRNWGPREVLRGIDLEIAPGRVVWLGGSNGAGKTTLLRIVAGLLAPHAGDVRLFGLSPTADRRAYQLKLGYLPAGNGGLYARLTVRQNMDFWSRLALMPRAARREAIERTIDDFGLAELADRRVDRMSMGQRQRVRMGMAFMHEPSFVLLDEPHTSLDDDGLAALQEAFSRHLARDGSAIWCSPSAAHANLGFDEGYVIDDGLLERAR